MARIPAEELEQLKRDIPIRQLVEDRGVQLNKHGANLLGLCPFHDDKQPSLVVTPDKNLWHCMGACQAGGSVIDWVMKAEGLSFRAAVDRLREAHGVTSAAPKHGPEQPSPLSTSMGDAELMASVVAYYHARLKQTPAGLDYLASRGLQHSELIDRFQLGFCDRTLGLRIPDNNLREGAELRARLTTLGILRPSGHEHLRGSVVVPIFDAQGHVVELYGRKVNGTKLRKGTPMHLYLPGPHRGVWNESALAATDELILCEALIDAMTFWCWGFRNVTASYGTEGFTDEHLEALRRHRIARLLIAYDRDEAGELAAAKLARRLCAEGLDCYRVELPRRMDVNEYAQKMQPADKALELVIRQARWMGKGKPPPARTTAEPQAATPATEPAEPTREQPATSEPATLEPELRPETIEPKSTPATKPPALSLVASESTNPAPATEAPEPPPPAPESTEARDPEPPATVQPPAPRPRLPVELRGDDLVFTINERSYRVRGLGKNTAVDHLKVNLLARRADCFHVDTLDLYAARQRGAFIREAAGELGVSAETVKRDLGRILVELEQLQDETIREALGPQRGAATMNETDRDAALELLRAPDLLERIGRDFERCGLIGETDNTLIGYLAAVSRKLERPLAIVIQSSSAAGKSTLMDAILAFVPEEDRVQYSAMTGQALFYMSEQDLRHRILAIAEEQGAQRASYALKLLQSEGEVSIASTETDPQSGRHATQVYRVEGPVMLFITTTSIDMDEELLNRCLVLIVSELVKHTQAIHAAQRRRCTLDGLQSDRDRERLTTLHQNAQRLLRPLRVVIPFAEQLTFPAYSIRTRRDHMKYLALIEASALLHQYQRPVRSVRHGDETLEYVEATLDDVAVVNRLAGEVLGHSLDEMPPQTRRLLEQVHEMVREACRRNDVVQQEHRFTRRDVRDYTGWGDTQLKVHLGRLVDLEYLVIHSGSHIQRHIYELRYRGEGAHGARFVAGLADLEHLRNDNRSGSEAHRSGENGNRSPRGRPVVGPWSARGRPLVGVAKTAETQTRSKS